MANSLLIYGSSNTFKTSNVGQAIEHIYATTGKQCRGIYGDNYGPIHRQIEDRLIEVWDMRTTNDPLACILLAGQGYWPTAFEGGKATGPLRMTQPGEFNGLGAYVVEGLQENGTLIMRNLEGKQRSTGEPLVAEFGEVVDKLAVQYAMASRGTYGFVQNQTHRYVNLYKGLPVEWFICSTHEESGKNKAGVNVCGPAIVGKAMIDKVAQWFDHVLHFQSVEMKVALSADAQKRFGVKDVTRMGSRAYFAKHQDPKTSLMWPAKLGVDPALMEHIYGGWPGGFIPLINGANGYVSSVATLLGQIGPVKEQPLDVDAGLVVDAGDVVQEMNDE